MRERFNLTKEEYGVLKSLSSPAKIQNFLDALPVNWEKGGDTIMSPRRVLRERKAHCLEGALLAAAALWVNGEEPLIINLAPLPVDDGHVIAIYKRRGHWGAFSKTNHATIRSRDPVYKTPRELAMSYFHEYFVNDTGIKSLRLYSRPFNLKRLGHAWLTDENDLQYVSDALDEIKHFPFIPRGNERHITRAHPLERKAGSIVEWEKENPRT
ncbi:hypothetical protein L0Y69_03030 [bacterium]|nr:hypothetical protein [bacterium]